MFDILSLEVLFLNISLLHLYPISLLAHVAMIIFMMIINEILMLDTWFH